MFIAIHTNHTARKSYIIASDSDLDLVVTRAEMYIKNVWSPTHNIQAMSQLTHGIGIHDFSSIWSDNAFHAFPAGAEQIATASVSVHDTADVHPDVLRGLGFDD